MDVKNGPSRYAQTAGVPGLDLGPIRESVVLLKQGRVPYEFRTTVVASLHDEASLLEAAEWLRGAQAWFLQQFVDSGGCFLNGLTAYRKKRCGHWLKRCAPSSPACASVAYDPLIQGKVSVRLFEHKRKWIHSI